MQKLARFTGAEWVTLRLADHDEPGLKLLAAAGSAVHASPPMPVLTNEETLAYAAKDDGLGMPPKVLSKIFEQFFTTKEVGGEPALDSALATG